MSKKRIQNIKIPASNRSTPHPSPNALCAMPLAPCAHPRNSQLAPRNPITESRTPNAERRIPAFSFYRIPYTLNLKPFFHLPNAEYRIPNACIFTPHPAARTPQLEPRNAHPAPRTPQPATRYCLFSHHFNQASGSLPRSWPVRSLRDRIAFLRTPWLSSCKAWIRAATTRGSLIIPRDRAAVIRT